MEQQIPAIKEQMMEVLVEYTETFLLPLLDERFSATENKILHKLNAEIGEVRYELKEYLDKKLASQTAEFFSRTDKRFDQVDKRLDHHEALLSNFKLRIEGARA